LEGQVAAQVLLLPDNRDHQVLFLVLLLPAQAAVELLDNLEHQDNLVMLSLVL
jgi:hypothetical protein